MLDPNFMTDTGGKISLDQEKRGKIQRRMTKLNVLIVETKKRLPANSTKPPVLLDLLKYEDQYDLLLKELNKFKTSE